MKTTRITPTLAIAFGLLIAILIVVGYWGVNRLAEMNGKVQTIVNQRWQKVQLSREALYYSSLNSRLTMQIFLVHGQQDLAPLLEQRAGNTQKISELMATIESGVDSDAETALVADIWARRIPYVNSYKLALNVLLQDGQPETGRQMMAGVVFTNLLAYHKAWETFVEYQGEQMDQAGRAANARYAAARREMIMLVLVATLLATAIALFVIRNLRREIASRLHAERSLQEAHDVLDLRVRRRTEALAETSSLLETMFENCPDCIYFKDHESRILYFSKSFRQLFHLDRDDDLKGRSDFDFFTREHAQPAYEDEQEIIRTGRPIIGKMEKETHADGRITWALTSKMPWRNKAGDIIGTFGISKDITELKEAEARLAQAHQELLEVSRRAGMAEVATGVLHNVGNVLNSVNVAATCISEGIRHSKAANLAKVVALFREHETDLGQYLTHDAKGRQVPGYLAKLAEHIAGEQAAAQKELTGLQRHINHIKDIVAMQQNFAKVTSLTETVSVSELVDDALKMNAASLNRHEIQIVQELEQVPPITVEKHKVLQILVNLVRNAKQSCDAVHRADKQVTLRVLNAGNRVRISVSDNGEGIPPENLTNIFNHGFTTKRDGHGFGLHSAANSAAEMGGTLQVHSDGPGTGATFTVELPLQPPEKFNA